MKSRTGSMSFSGKSRATGYSDFYKGNSKAPGAKLDSRYGSDDDEKEEDPRKTALKRRLAKLRGN